MHVYIYDEKLGLINISLTSHTYNFRGENIKNPLSNFTIFVFVVHAGLEFLDSSGPSASASYVAGNTGVHQHAWHFQQFKNVGHYLPAR
jgi:hypothetical protein